MNKQSYDTSYTNINAVNYRNNHVFKRHKKSIIQAQAPIKPAMRETVRFPKIDI